MKTFFTRIIAVIAIIALAAALPISAIAETETSRVESAADIIPSELGCDMPNIKIVSHKTDNPERSEIWDGSIATGFSGGSGTEEDPYLICDGSELAYLAQQVNGGNGYSGVYFKLTNDIYLNDTSNWESWGTGAAPANGWAAIGTWGNYFDGCFNGNGYAVHGIYISTQENYQGLFGYIGDAGDGSIIANLGVAESYICGYRDVGGVVGSTSWGNITNCYNTGTVTGNSDVGGVFGGIADTNVTKCYNTGVVTGDECVGGIVGGIDGANTNINNCYNTGNVSGNKEVGGVVGYIADTNVTKCYSTGAVTGDECVGGIVGRSASADGWAGDVTNCYNTGSVSGDTYVGGVVGTNEGWYAADGFGGNVTNCYNIGIVTGGSTIGGVVGFNGDYATVANSYYLDTCCDSGNEYGTALTDEQMQASDSFTGFDFVEVWTMEGNSDYPYPELIGNSHVGISADPTPTPATPAPAETQEPGANVPPATGAMSLIGIGVAAVACGVALIRRKK